MNKIIEQNLAKKNNKKQNKINLIIENYIETSEI